MHENPIPEYSDIKPQECRFSAAYRSHIETSCRRGGAGNVRVLTAIFEVLKTFFRMDYSHFQLCEKSRIPLNLHGLYTSTYSLFFLFPCARYQKLRHFCNQYISEKIPQDSQQRITMMIFDTMGTIMKNPLSKTCFNFHN